MQVKEKCQLVNTVTGLVIDEKYLNENEQAQAEVKIRKEKSDKEKAIINNKDELRRSNNRLGGFIEIMYVEKELLFNKLGLDSSDVARVLYLATYMDYENRNDGLLVKRIENNKLNLMTRKDLFKEMKLSDKAFRTFINTIKEAGLLREEEGLFYMNTDYFKKGKVSKKETYTRLYIDTTRKLYEGCTARQHKQLGYILQLIPFASYDLNILENEGKRLSIEEICQLVGLSTERKTTSKMHRELKKFTVKNEGKEYYLFGTIDVNNITGYCINPLVSYRGSDMGEKRAIIKLMLFNKTVEELNKTYRKKVK